VLVNNNLGLISHLNDVVTTVDDSPKMADSMAHTEEKFNIVW